MSTPYLSEIRIAGFNFPPKGWAFCNGQLLPIAQDTALFSLLGTTYGGDGITTFQLPNLQGRVPVHMGPGFTLGQIDGEPTHTLNISEMPAHNHVPVGSSSSPTASAPTGNLWATETTSPYAGTANTSMNPACVQNAGSSQPHDNMSPYLVLNFIIALQGIFPSRT
ncbi:MAG TPA: tail fiber protein [Candidatus Angelobacter sp.]